MPVSIVYLNIALLRKNTDMSENIVCMYSNLLELIMLINIFSIVKKAI